MSIAQTTKTKRLTRAYNGTLMTSQEFDAVQEWDERYRFELINGVVIVSPHPAEGERGPNDTLGYWLLSYRDQNPEGFRLDATLPEQTIFGSENRRRADRAIWLGLGRLPNLQLDVPSIVAEFVSKRKRDRTRDYEEKRREYQAIGVSEYWVIDRFQRTMTVYKSMPGELAELIVKAEETYRTPLLPGFELPLAKLLKVADDWTKSQTQRKGKKSSEPPK
jgi:Uma2 family endonuclease